MAGFKGKSSSATSRPGTKSKDNRNSNNKKNPSKKSTPNPPPPPPKPPTSTTSTPSLPRHHQQLTLNIFRDTFAAVLSSETFTSKLQTLKQALFERDFARAFGGEDADALAVYAARWSPTRALCYASIFCQIHEQGHLRGLMTGGDIELLPKSLDHLSLGETTTTTPTPEDENEPTPSPKGKVKGRGNGNVLKLLSIGGGAAEIVAFGSFLGHIHIHHTSSSSSSSFSPPTQDSNSATPQKDNQNPVLLLPAGRITLLDSGPWDSVISQLQQSLTTPPPISKYASVSLRESNRPMISSPDLFHSTFIQQDVLELDKDGLECIIDSPSSPILVTLLFTLNELFTTSGILKTTTFLLNLTAALPMGSLLLVVDSPGSYSETTLGKGTSDKTTTTTTTGNTGTGTVTGKKYPMQWLLDKILLETAKEPVDGRAAWKKLESHDSVWFRLPDDGDNGKGLDYPIPLENMRYQMHLYRLVDFDSLKEEEEEQGDDD